MGTGASTTKSSTSLEERAAQERHVKIEKEIAKSQEVEARTVKLLLLGGAESGKSTFAKQMRILHLNGFSEEEMNHYRYLVNSNVVLCIQQFLYALKFLKVDVSKSVEQDINYFRNFCEESRCIDFQITSEVASTIKRLWKSANFQECYERRMEFDLLDSAKYFLEDIDRIASKDFKPNAQDILRSRAATLGIHEIEFQFKEYTFKMVDVGGQKTERRKWIHCFDNVTAILFISALSEYDQFLAEDREKNRMHDSLSLFKSIASNGHLTKSSILLFLNKKDIFVEKIAQSPLKACFPDYAGGNNYNEASEYILTQYLKQVPSNKTVYNHFTNATDTKNVEVVFAAAVNTILNKALSTIGMS